MKRTWKTAIVLLLIASVLMLTSCDGMFTRSVMKGAARDPEAASKALASKSTKSLVADAGEAADPTAAKAVVGALSSQAKDDPTVITSLSTEDKKKIVDAAMTAVIDLTSLAGDVDLNAMMSGEGSDDDDAMTDILGSIVDNLGDCDLYCVQVILDDSLDANGNLKSDVDPDMYSTLALGAITVAASSVQGAGMDINDLMDAMDNDSTDANGLLGPDASAEDVASLESALKTLAALSAAGYEFEDAFGV